MIVTIPALPASHAKMSAFEAISHASGRYAKRLHHERPKDKGQYEGRNQPFKRVCNFVRPVFLFSRLLVGAAFFSLVWRHKRRSCCIRKLFAGLFGAETKILIMPSNPLPVNRVFCIGPIFTRDRINKSLISNRLREKNCLPTQYCSNINRRTSFREVHPTATADAFVPDVFFSLLRKFQDFFRI
jgi:hypothetical protein